MAGRRAAIGTIRLVAPCAPVCGLALTCLASVARVRLVDPLNRRLSCSSSSHVIPNHTFPFVRGAFARAADLYLSSQRVRAAPFAFSCGVSRHRRSSPVLHPPREGWAERREAHF